MDPSKGGNRRGAQQAARCSDHDNENALLPTVESCGFEQHEEVVLNALRHICCDFLIEDYDGRRPAWETLALQWSPTESADMLDHLKGLMRAIRENRTMPFDFIGPNCPHCSKRICMTELQVMLLLREARIGHPAKLAYVAQLVVGQGESEAVIAAAEKLARLVRLFEGQKGGDVRLERATTASATVH